MPNTAATAISSNARCQLINKLNGSNNNTRASAEKSSRKNEIQMFHSASVPAIITFISRPEWAVPWKASGSCSTCSK